jgi:hypothetical protein
LVAELRLLDRLIIALGNPQQSALPHTVRRRMPRMFVYGRREPSPQVLRQA